MFNQNFPQISIFLFEKMLFKLLPVILPQWICTRPAKKLESIFFLFNTELIISCFFFNHVYTSQMTQEHVSDILRALNSCLLHSDDEEVVKNMLS